MRHVASLAAVIYDNLSEWLNTFLPVDRDIVIAGALMHDVGKLLEYDIDMRLFIAINLSSQIKEELINVQNVMYDHGVQGNYTSEDNMHLTLAFIGDYPDPQPVLEALSDVEFTPFNISLDGIGCFSNLWWAGIKESVPLESVVRRVRRALAEHSIPFDKKRFFPHITLIRKATNNMPGVQVHPIEMTVERIALMRSDRGRNGMIYTEVGIKEASET